MHVLNSTHRIIKHLFQLFSFSSLGIFFIPVLRANSSKNFITVKINHVNPDTGVVPLRVTWMPDRSFAVYPEYFVSIPRVPGAGLFSVAAVRLGLSLAVCIHTWVIRSYILELWVFGYIFTCVCVSVVAITLLYSRQR